MESGKTADNLIETNVSNLVSNPNLKNNEAENKNEVEFERASTPEQSPSTKTQLRKVCYVLFKIIIS